MQPASRAPTGWLWAGGVALLVFAARSREIERYASDVPFLDQWWVEARQIIIPWLRGKLSWTDFFRPHHEHFPVWTRLLAWGEAALFGRWDPGVQCTLNAALFAAVVGGWAAWVRRVMPFWPALVLTTLAVALAALPHGWENNTWGFQSLVPIATGLVLFHIVGSYSFPPGRTTWWLAQAAGFGALGTFGSMGSAAAAVAFVAVWTATPGRKTWLVPALIAALGVILFVAARAVQPHSGAYAQVAASPQQFLAALLIQLGWPSAWPAAALVLLAPALLLALALRRQAAATALDRIALALALHGAVQALAFAYGRAGGYVGFVSRYGDLLALGSLGQGLALWRLWAHRAAHRAAVAGLAGIWLAAFGVGLNYISTRAHTEYFHGHTAAWTTLRRDAVQQYLRTEDASGLARAEVRAVLYPDPAIVTAVLDQPGLRALLPASVRGDGKAVPGDLISDGAHYLRTQALSLAWVGGLFLSLGFLFGRPPPSVVEVSLPTLASDPWAWRTLCGLAVITAAGTLLWPRPWEYRPAERWGRIATPPGTLPELQFKITTPTTYQVDNLTGGAALWPEDFRNTFYGTHIDGPGFTGRAESAPFALHSPWLVIPFAGFPASPGNQLQLEIVPAGSAPAVTLVCPGPNPTDIDFWSVDVRAYAGRNARVVLVDGRDDAEGWVAASPPQPSGDPERAARHRRSWALERTASGHASLGGCAAGLALAAGGCAFAGRRSRKKNLRTGAAAS